MLVVIDITVLNQFLDKISWMANSLHP